MPRRSIQLVLIPCAAVCPIRTGSHKFVESIGPNEDTSYKDEAALAACS
jgi:hypothetical protein